MKDGKLCFVLGREKFEPRKGLYGPPVGAKEDFDVNSSHTAFRETCEETNDIICPVSIRDKPNHFVIKDFPHKSKFWIVQLDNTNNIIKKLENFNGSQEWDDVDFFPVMNIRNSIYGKMFKDANVSVRTDKGIYKEIHPFGLSVIKKTLECLFITHLV